MTKELRRMEKEKKPKVINCASCGKPLKKLKRYYRDGKYWCDKNCWKKLKKEAKE